MDIAMKAIVLNVFAMTVMMAQTAKLTRMNANLTNHAKTDNVKMKLVITGVNVRQALMERIAKLTSTNVNLTHANTTENVRMAWANSCASVMELVSKVTHAKIP